MGNRNLGTSVYMVFVVLGVLVIQTREGSAQSYKDWNDGSDPCLASASPLGGSIKVKIDDTIALKGTVLDSDVYWLYCIGDEDLDYTENRYSCDLGTLSTILRVENEEIVYWTAPSETGSGNIILYGDDGWEGAETGVTSPETGERNDAEKGLKTWSVEVVQGCPDSVDLGSSCVGTDPGYETFGFRRYKMIVKPAEDDWDKQVINETVELADIQGESACSNDDLQGAEVADFCKGASSFTVGEGQTAIYGCGGLPTHNAFYDNHSYVDQSVSVLPDDEPSSCTVKCDQVFKCCGSTIGSFTITYTLTYNSGETDISVSKS